MKVLAIFLITLGLTVLLLRLGCDPKHGETGAAKSTPRRAQQLKSPTVAGRFSTPEAASTTRAVGRGAARTATPQFVTVDRYENRDLGRVQYGMPTPPAATTTDSVRPERIEAPPAQISQPRTPRQAERVHSGGRSYIGRPKLGPKGKGAASADALIIGET